MHNTENKQAHKKLEKQVGHWEIAGRTLPFIAMAGMLVCAIFANNYIVQYAIIVTVLWVAVSVAWWWWALKKILHISAMLVRSTENFDSVKQELTTLKNDIRNRKRPE